MTENRLFLTGQTLADLKRKLHNPPPELAPLWRHFLLLARRNPFWLSSYSILAFLVTGEDEYRRLARDIFLKFTETKDDSLLTWEVQFHTHTVCAPLGRLMVFYDWIADTDLLSADEKQAFENAALDFSYVTPMQQLQGRARSFDNQIFANAFGGALAGYILGIRRGDSALARRLYAIGTETLIDQYRRLPRCCYSGEGSSYNEQVVGPLLLLGGLFLEEVLGIPVYERGLEPNYVSLRDWYTMSLNMIGPGGILPGWDAYGGANASVKAPLVYWARRESCPEPLAVIRDTDMWYPLNNAAWEMDDRLWTMVWWPSELKIPAAASFRPWLNSYAAGALQSPATQIRLFQYWDECGGAPHNGRPNVNPNAIQFDFAGIPLLLDGASPLPTEYLRVSVDEILNYVDRQVLVTLLKYWGTECTEANLRKAALHAVSGSVGESNSLVIDRENWFVPLRPVAGRGRALHAAGSLQVIESEAAEYYTDRYDVTRVDRISALLGGRYAITVDDVAARTAHTFTWQAFTWPGARIDGNRVVAGAGGEVRLDIVPGVEGKLEITPITGFPPSPCKGSTRVEFTLPKPVAEARLPVCLVPQMVVEPVLDLSTGWELTVEGQSVARDVDLNTYYLEDAVPPGSTLTFRRTVTLDGLRQQAGTMLRLRTAVPTIRLSVNGQPVEELYEQHSLHLQGQSKALPHVYEVGAVLRPGENVLAFTLQSWHGESIKGPVSLLAPKEAFTPAFSVHSPTEFSVRLDGGTDHILLANEATMEWHGGRTDARHALLAAGGELVLAGVTTAAFPALALDLKASQPVDFALHGSRLEFGELPANANVVLRLREALIYVSAMAITQISWRTNSPLELTLLCDKPRQFLFNGKQAGSRGGPSERTVSVTLTPPSDGATAIIRTAEDVYRLGEEFGATMEHLLLECLGSNDWRIQVAAADVIGHLGIKTAVPALLRLFEQEEAAAPHPRLLHSWVRSKMKESLFADVDQSPDRETDPVEGVKRYRLKRAVVTALGQLGDSRAIPYLHKAMERGTDFFPTLSQLPIALARLNSQASIPMLEENRDNAEGNTKLHVRLALQYLKGEINRAEFEARVNPS